MKLCQWKIRWGLGKGSSPEGSGHSPSTGVKDCLENALKGFGFWVVLTGAMSWVH